MVASEECRDVNEAFALWSKTHKGGLDVFYDFMTTPSVERELFLDSIPHGVERKGSLFRVII